jgi:hypothetical protein
MDNFDKYLGMAAIMFVFMLFGGLIGGSLYQAHLRQECVLASASRPAIEVLVVCGKP